VLLLGLCGTSFLYAGEELGLEDADVPRDRRGDPGGRDGCRAPIPWDATPTHGWPTADPWLPWPPEPGTRNLDTERADARSIIHLYRRLLATRRASTALRLGTLAPREGPANVVAFEREARGERWTVLVNFGDAPAACPAQGTVMVASDGMGEGGRYAGVLAPVQGLWLR
jgi:alpha-glucosidase